MQHFVLGTEDGVYAEESKQPSTFQGGFENRDVEPLEASGVAEVGWVERFRSVYHGLASLGGRDPGREGSAPVLHRPVESALNTSIRDCNSSVQPEFR